MDAHQHCEGPNSSLSLGGNSGGNLCPDTAYAWTECYANLQDRLFPW